MGYSYVKNTKYYRGIVYEFNLPSGTTCPFAETCKVSVDRHTGKFKNEYTEYRCYAANPERFPAVRNHRWLNFEYVKSGGVPTPPKDAKSIRIHASGDFFNQKYFDTWIQLALENPNIEIWSYTKSIRYWVARIKEIPENLILTASYGGKDDHLIEEYMLKNVKVYKSIEDVPEGMGIDTNDDLARVKNIDFALVDNFYKRGKLNEV